MSGNIPDAESKVRQADCKEITLRLPYTVVFITGQQLPFRLW